MADDESNFGTRLREEALRVQAELRLDDRGPASESDAKAIERDIKEQVAICLVAAKAKASKGALDVDIMWVFGGETEEHFRAVKMAVEERLARHSLNATCAGEYDDNYATFQVTW